MKNLFKKFIVNVVFAIIMTSSFVTVTVRAADKTVTGSAIFVSEETCHISVPQYEPHQCPPTTATISAGTEKIDKNRPGENCTFPQKISVPKKVKYFVEQKRGKVKLIKTNGTKRTTICSVKFKKKIVTFDGKKYQNIKSVGYTSNSKNILLGMTNGNFKVIPCKNGELDKSRKITLIKGKWKHTLKRANGLTFAISNEMQCKSVSSIK